MIAACDTDDAVKQKEQLTEKENDVYYAGGVSPRAAGVAAGCDLGGTCPLTATNRCVDHSRDKQQGRKPMRTLAVLTLAACLLATASIAVELPGFDYSANKIIKAKGRFGVLFTDQKSISGVTEGFGMFRIGISSVERIFDKFQVTEVRPLCPPTPDKANALNRVYIITIPDDVDDEQFLAAMRADPNVAGIENDIACLVAATPSDPSYGSQWALYQTSRRDIHAPEAWETETGSDTAIIAFIDTGVNYKHPDLMNNIWVNPGEDLDGDGEVFDQSDINGVDDDGNGYVDDLIGYDFFTGGSLQYPVYPGEDGSMRDNDPNDFNGHGTHCAGIATAVTNNGLNGAGVAGGWGPYRGDGGARIMCLRAGYSADVGGGQEAGYVLMSAVVEAINYAARNGADVISYSAGSDIWTGLPQALSAAMDSGIVFCAAAGNDGSNVAGYFGVYDGILAVAATNSYDRKWSGSNFGYWVEVSAPGQDIYSTYSYHYNPTYATLTGTSMAAPMVSGLAALIKSHYPSFDKTQINAMILAGADNIDAQNPTYIDSLGAGRINAANCLQNAPLAKFSASPRVGPAPLAVTFTDLSPAATSWNWSFGDATSSTDQNPPPHAYTSPGLYTVSLEVTDPNGTHKEVRKYHVFAIADTLYGPSSIIVPAIPTDSFPVPIYLKNSIPLDGFTLCLRYANDSGTAALQFKGVTVTGTRAASFDQVTVKMESTPDSKVAILFDAATTTAKEPLPPGDGIVANLWFRGSGLGWVRFDTTTLSSYTFKVDNRFAAYLPDYRSFRAFVGRRGDANADGEVNAGDAVFLINRVFKSGPPPPCDYNGDANNDTQINVGDVVYLINFIFRSGPPPPPY
jgi:subtilisin family serine protease